MEFHYIHGSRGPMTVMQHMHHTFLYCSIDIYPISSTKSNNYYYQYPSPNGKMKLYRSIGNVLRPSIAMPLLHALPYSIIAKTRAEHLLYAHWKPPAVAHKVRVIAGLLLGYWTTAPNLSRPYLTTRNAWSITMEHCHG